MRWASVAGLALAIALLFTGGASARPGPPLPTVRVLVLDRGNVRVRVDRLAVGTVSDAARTSSPALPLVARTAGGRSFAGELRRLAASGAIAQDLYGRARGTYDAARRSERRISGTRRAELGAVLANVDAIAAAGRLIPSRLPALVETLRRNRQWWTTGPLLSSGDRVGFPRSRLIWEYYPGQGIEIQWLGTFGKANAYYLSRAGGALSALLAEAAALATDRAGGIAWEYDFQFDGGRPPWVSALAQGTAIQAFARGGRRRGHADETAIAHRALGIFGTPPPEGVVAGGRAGSHYLIYSFAPRERVLNGFLQSLVGLHDLAVLGDDARASVLFARGDAEARVEVPRYDTGAWSLYDQATESDLSYHELVRGFLLNLCGRARADARGHSAAVAAALHGQFTLTALGLAHATQTGSGGAGAPGSSSQGADVTPPSSRGDEIYCATAAHFHHYQHVAPVVRALTAHARPGSAGRLRLELSKISVVRTTVRGGGRTAYASTLTLSRGLHSLGWIAPTRRGSYVLTITATDLAGNVGSARARVTVG